MKTIAQFEKDFRKIPIDFQDKYLLIKKWVLLHSHSKVSLPFEMHSVYVKDNLFEVYADIFRSV